jgi:hypothetical protein
VLDRLLEENWLQFDGISAGVWPFRRESRPLG